MLPVSSSYPQTVSKVMAEDKATDDEINYIGMRIVEHILSDDKMIRFENCYTREGNVRVVIKTKKNKYH